MWKFEREEIAAKAVEWCNERGYKVTPFTVVVALDNLGFLQDVIERSVQVDCSPPAEEAKQVLICAECHGETATNHVATCSKFRY